MDFPLFGLQLLADRQMINDVKVVYLLTGSDLTIVRNLTLK